MISPKVEYFYFGRSHQSIFGCYHPPDWDNQTDCGVLLCSPFGHENVRAHRAYRQLAVRIASAGLHVLRFDYYGSGDSNGDLNQARLIHWIENIGWAIEQLKQRGRLQKLFIGGLRLGAALAVVATEMRKDVKGYVLWEPVMSGADYLEDIRLQHSQYVAEMHREFRNLYAGGHEPSEILGFELTSALEAAIKEIDLMSTTKLQNMDILIVSNDSLNKYQNLVSYFNKNQNRVDSVVIQDQRLWLERPYKALVPVHTIRAITDWLSHRIV